MAAELANLTKANLLVLNHHSGQHEVDTQVPARDAESAIKVGTRVLSACDFMELAVPREGFRFVEERQAAVSSQNATSKRKTQQGTKKRSRRAAAKGRSKANQ